MKIKPILAALRCSRPAPTGGRRHQDALHPSAAAGAPHRQGDRPMGRRRSEGIRWRTRRPDLRRRQPGRGAQRNIIAVAKGDIECAFSLNFQWGKTLPMMNVTVAPLRVRRSRHLAQMADLGAAEFLEQKLLEKGVRNVVWMFQTNTSRLHLEGPSR